MRTPIASRDVPTRWSTWFWSALLGVVILRLWLAATLPLSGDEAYHWEWSRHLAPGYYDHPALTAWAIAASTRLLGSTSELGVRLPAILAMAAVAFLCRRFALRVAGSLGLAGASAERAASLAGLLVLCVPMFAFFGVHMSGDALLFLAWTLAMDQGWRAITERGWRPWIGLGLAVGAGVQTKFLFFPFVLAFALLLLSAPLRRRWFRRPEPWAALALAFALTVPFLRWNAAHDWATFRFNLTTRHDFLGGGAAFLELLASQALVLTPVVFALAVLHAGAVVARWRRASEAERFLALLVVVPLAGYAVQSLLGTQVGAHWPAAGMLAALVLLSIRIEQQRRAGAHARAARLTLATLGVSAFLTLAGHALLLVPPGALANLPLAHPTRAEQFHSGRLAELHGWRELGERVGEVRAAMRAAQTPQPEGVFLLAAQYGVAAQVAFYTPGQPRVMLWEPPRRHGQSYRDWDRFASFRGQDALFVTKKEKRLERALAELREHFERVHEPERVPILRDGRELRAFHLVRCEGFDGEPASFP